MCKYKYKIISITSLLILILNLFIDFTYVVGDSIDTSLEFKLEASNCDEVDENLNNLNSVEVNKDIDDKEGNEFLDSIDLTKDLDLKIQNISVEVENFEELKKALKNNNVSHIKITEDIYSTDTLVVNRTVTIEGDKNGNKPILNTYFDIQNTTYENDNYTSNNINLTFKNIILENIEIVHDFSPENKKVELLFEDSKINSSNESKSLPFIGIFKGNINIRNSNIKINNNEYTEYKELDLFFLDEGDLIIENSEIECNENVRIYENLAHLNKGNINIRNSNIKINNNEYTEYKELDLFFLDEGDLIIENSEIECNENVRIYGNLTHLNIVGSKIKFSGNESRQEGGAIYLGENGELNIDGSEVEFSGNESIAKGGAIYLGENGELNINGSKIKFSGNESRQEGGAIYLGENGELNVDNNSKIEFDENTGSFGGAIYLGENGELNINGSEVEFSGNESRQEGGAIYLGENGELNINGSEVEFSGNESRQEGGAIYLGENGALNINGSEVEFSGNESRQEGGAIYLGENGELNIDGSEVEFSGNESRQEGGAIYLGENGELNVDNNSKIEFNENTGSFGGAIYLGKNGELNINGSEVEFSGNESRQEGGAIYLGENGALNINGSEVEFSGNGSIAKGGAIYLGKNGELNVDNNSKIKFNKNTGSFGGAVYLYNSSINSEGVLEVVNNISKQDSIGGAIYFLNNDLNINDIEIVLKGKSLFKNNISFFDNFTIDEIIRPRINIYIESLTPITLDIKNASFIDDKNDIANNNSFLNSSIIIDDIISNNDNFDSRNELQINFEKIYLKNYPNLLTVINLDNLKCNIVDSVFEGDTVSLITGYTESKINLNLNRSFINTNKFNINGNKSDLIPQNVEIENKLSIDANLYNNTFLSEKIDLNLIEKGDIIHNTFKGVNIVGISPNTSYKNNIFIAESNSEKLKNNLKDEYNLIQKSEDGILKKELEPLDSTGHVIKGTRKYYKPLKSQLILNHNSISNMPELEIDMIGQTRNNKVTLGAVEFSEEKENEDILDNPKDDDVIDLDDEKKEGESNIPEEKDDVNLKPNLPNKKPSSTGGAGDGKSIKELENEKVEEKIEQEKNKKIHQSYIEGYKDNTIRPETNISREEVATIFYRLLDDEYKKSIEIYNNNYKDVSSDRWSNEYISILSEEKVLTGYKDGTFKPKNDITRGEVAVIVSRFANINPTKASSKFLDIKGHWAEGYINAINEKGWINGYKDGSFRPNQKITRAELITIVNNMLNRKIRKENILEGIKKYNDLNPKAWYYEEIIEATNSHEYEENRLEDGSEVWTKIIYPEIEM